MRIKNAFKILIGNSTVIYKSTFFKLITTSLITLIAYFVISADLGYLFNSVEVHDFWNAILTTLTNFIKGNGLDTELLPKAFEAVVEMLKINAIEISIALIKVTLFIFLHNLVERMCNFAIGFLTEGYMSALTKYSLVASLFLNFGKALIYSLIIVPIAIIFDGLVLTLAIIIAVYGLRIISIFAIIIAIIFVVLAISCKYTVFSTFLPSIVGGEKTIRESFVNCFKKRDKFMPMLGNYAFAIMISFYLNVSVAVFTLGVGLIISIPLTSVFIVLLNFVDYYQLQGKRYYVSADEVVTPRQRHKHADLLKYM